MFYLCYLFLYFSYISPPISEPPNASGWLVGFSYPVIGFFVSSLYFWGNGEIAPYFTKNLTVPSFGELLYPNG